LLDLTKGSHIEGIKHMTTTTTNYPNVPLDCRAPKLTSSKTTNPNPGPADS